MLMVETLNQAANLSRVTRSQNPVRVIAVTGGKDINTRARTDGKSIAYHALQVWPSTRIVPVSEAFEDRTIQYDRLSGN